MKTKKLFTFLALSVVFATLCSGISNATYTNGPANLTYNRTAAGQYVYNYTLYPNSSYSYFDYALGYGGDCTNFASQVLYAGGTQMTPSVSNPWTDDWYYYGGAQ